jgi:hypothetical protein
VTALDRQLKQAVLTLAPKTALYVLLGQMVQSDTLKSSPPMVVLKVPAGHCEHEPGRPKAPGMQSQSLTSSWLPKPAPTALLSAGQLRQKDALDRAENCPVGQVWQTAVTVPEPTAGLNEPAGQGVHVDVPKP